MNSCSDYSMLKKWTVTVSYFLEGSFLFGNLVYKVRFPIHAVPKVKTLPPHSPLTSFYRNKILTQVATCVIHLWGIWTSFYCLESCRGHTVLPKHSTYVYLKCPLCLEADAISSQLPLSAHCSCIYHSGTSCCSCDTFSVT